MSGDDMGNDKKALACGKSLNDSIDFSFYKTLFDPVRSDILIYLVSHGKKNIKEISENFTQDRSVISKHLDLMHRYGIVLKEKRDRRIYYEANSKFVVEQFEKTTNNLNKILRSSDSRIH
jgi:predicted transcriptional regulator